MITKNYNFVRDNLKEMIDKVNEHEEVIKVTTDTHNAVLMSENTYNAIQETLYLNENPYNAKRIAESIRNIEHRNNEID